MLKMMENKEIGVKETEPDSENAFKKHEAQDAEVEDLGEQEQNLLAVVNPMESESDTKNTDAETDTIEAGTGAGLNFKDEKSDDLSPRITSDKAKESSSSPPPNVSGTKDIVEADPEPPMDPDLLSLTQQIQSLESQLQSERREFSRREKVLITKSTSAERQINELERENCELKKSILVSSLAGSQQNSLKDTLCDPAVNLIIQRLRGELDETKKKLEDTQNDLSAWKFTPDSNVGKRLMAKCRLLHLENEDLGRQVASGRIAKLENDLALQKSLVGEMKQSQAELDEMVQELDEDVEGLQAALHDLQQQTTNISTSSGGPSPEKMIKLS